MANKLLARFALCLSFTAAALVSMYGSSFAAQGSGIVVTYHLNVTIAGRGACIRTNPALPGNGWACVYDTEQLYDELNALLSGEAQHSRAMRGDGHRRARLLHG